MAVRFGGGRLGDSFGPGLPGPKGDTGSSITFKATVASVAELNALTGMAEDDARVVTENGHIYIYDGASWVDGGQFLGPTGPQGEPGEQGPQGLPGTGSESAAALQHQVKAGEALVKGQAVYVSSSNGTNMVVSKASNIAEASSSKTMGLITTSVILNDFGIVITEGLLSGLDTSTANAGDPVWLGTNGNLIYGLQNKPYAPAHLVFIGIVTRVQSQNGEIFVKVQNGFELNELHNVFLENDNAIADNEIFAFDSSSSLWKNQTKTEAGFATVAASGSYSDLINKPTIPTNLDSLTDVVVSTPTNKQLLVYNTATSEWVNADPIDAGGIAYKAGVPAAPTSTGQVGQLAIDGVNGVLYVCTSTNNWQKVSLNAANFTNAGGFV